MTTNQIIGLIEKSGIKCTKERLMEIIRSLSDKEFSIMKDKTSNYTIVKIKGL